MYIESNGIVYLLASTDSAILRTIDNIASPSTNGIYVSLKIPSIYKTNFMQIQ